MPRASGRASPVAASALLLCGLAGPARAADLAAPGTGLPAVLGPGAAALADVSLGAFGNPALLADAPRAEARADLGLGADDSPWQRLGIAWVSGGAAMAFGVLHAEATDDDAARESYLLAHGRALPGGVRLGAALELRAEHATGAGDRSFGLDLGSSGRLAGFDLGAVVRHVVRPERVGGAPETVGFEAGAARAVALRGAWRGTGTLGWEGAEGASGAVWLGARIAWKERFEVSGSGTRGQTRAGLGLRRGGVAIEYAVEAAETTHHALGLRVALGTGALERRAAAERRADSLLAARVDRALTARQAREVASRLRSAEQALDAGAHDRAAELYREVLLWSPDYPAALAGLQRAQRGAMLAQADTAIARHDWGRATSQLELALQLFPEDSLAAAKLEQAQGAMRRADQTRSEAAAQVRLGLDAYAAQRYALAARRFEAALRLDPANQTAGEFLPRSRAAHEEQMRGALALARARLERHDPEGARAALEPAFVAAPETPEVVQLAAEIDRELERQERERKLADARRRTDPAREDRSPPPVSTPQLAAAYEHGMQLYRAGDLPSAMTAWEAVARVAPHFEEVDRYLLRVYRVVGLESYTEGRLQEAIEVWSKALRLEPENPQVRRYLEQANAKLQRAQDSGGAR